MVGLENLMNNNALAGILGNAPQGVKNAIQQASSRTGVNFAYLVQQAQAESSFNPEAKAKTSSATGLFQFIESTWMNMVDKHGHKHGIETETKSREEILEMRNDPKMASLMAAEFASDNERFLKQHYKGDVGATELYFAHFLGASGAAGFLNARADNPLQRAADIMPKAAAANRNVFYESGTGRARTLEEVYAYFDKKFADETPTVVADKSNELQNRFTPKSDIRPLNSFDYVKYNQDNMKQMAFEMLTRPANQGTQRLSNTPLGRLINSPVDIMLMAQFEPPLTNKSSSEDKS